MRTYHYNRDGYHKVSVYFTEMIRVHIEFSAKRTMFCVESKIGGDDWPINFVFSPALFWFSIGIYTKWLRDLTRNVAEFWAGRVTGIAVLNNHLSIRVWYDEGFYKPSGFYKGVFLRDRKKHGRI